VHHHHSQSIQQEKLFLKLSRAGQSHVDTRLLHDEVHVQAQAARGSHTHVIAGILLNQDPRVFAQLNPVVQRAPFQSLALRHLIALDRRLDTEMGRLTGLLKRFRIGVKKSKGS
jgi:hypothetical protein